jgi:replicative DNA helicase
MSDDRRKRPRRDDNHRDNSPLPGPESLPQALEAERSVLGSMLRDNAVIGDLVQIVRAESFYLDAHQKIFLAVVSLYDRGHPVDAVVLTEELKQRGDLENVGGYAYLGELWTAAPTAANAEYYGRIVRDRAVVRNLIHASNEILRDAYDNTSAADELLGEAERKILEVAQLGITGQTFTLEQALQDAYDRIDARTTGDALARSGLPMGFTDLDEITAGLQNSEMIIVAARPSVGKCLAHDAEIVLEDGSITTIEEIYRAQRARLLTLEKNWKLGVTEPSAYVDDGRKPVFRVTTRLGRQVETTLSHPFLTIDGWMPLAALRVGERIAVPRRIPVFGSEAIPERTVVALARQLRSMRWTRRVLEPIEAERSFLGSLIRGNDTIDDSSPARSFSVAAHQRIFEAISSLQQRGMPVDLVVLAEELHQRGDFENVGQAAIELWEAAPSATVTEQHVVAVPDAVFRLPREQLAIFLRTLLGDPGDTFTTTSERLVRQLQHLLLRFGVLAGIEEHDSTWSLTITDPESLDGYQTAILGDGEILSGTSDISWDKIVSIEPLGERQVYDLTIPTTHNFVANDVCVHNTAFALNFVRNIIVDEKQPVFFVSLEQSRIELAERLLCSQARVDGHRLRTGNLSPDDMQRLIDAGGVLRTAKLFIDDSPGQGMLRIAANARRLRLRQNIRLVVIDYLQLIEPENRRDPRQEQVAQISRRLKGLARELNIPVVALAQVNRSSEDRQDHRPRVSDLRESGCLVGDSLVTLADSGRRVPIRDLVGQSGFRIWALDEQTLKLHPAEASNAFCTGRKPVFRLQTRLRREIRATGNHPFRGMLGWQRLDQLTAGARIALPTALAAGTGVQWDEILSITPDGEEDVYDLTVPGPANFVANGIIVHNSIEQDADTIFLLHRPERYEPGQHEGIVEVIIGKQRNGPVGEVTLSYVKQYMRYENYRVGNPFEG